MMKISICLFHEQVIAESLSEEEIAGLREMFQAMDTDNSGAITFDELKAGLRRYGSTLKDTEIRDLMDAVSFCVCVWRETCVFALSGFIISFCILIIFFLFLHPSFSHMTSPLCFTHSS